jgi:glycosyltransferase involved in cell wall biosynthesis
MAEQPLRVLHVSQPTEGGVAVCVVNIAADQVRRGWDAAVACPPQGDLAQHLKALGILHVPWHATRSPGLSALREARDLRWIVRHLAPDVLHLHSSKAGLSGRLPPYRDGTPTIFQPHGWSWLAARGTQARAVLLWERYAARKHTDALVCVGPGELHQGRAAGVHGPYRLIRNGVDLTKFTPADTDDRRAARTTLGLPQEVPLAVCVGRVTRQKGQDVLIDAWKRVREKCPRAVLALVGDGDELPRLRRAAASMECDVLFVPPVADTREWLAAAHVVVMPSRWEGLPLVALEAMARGRSLVCSDIPGLAEVVQDGTGAVVHPDDPEALAAALVARLSRPDDADAEGRAAAVTARDHDLSETLTLLARLTAEIAARTTTPAESPQEGPAEFPPKAGFPPKSSR